MSSLTQQERFTVRQKLLAWSIHLFTASGAVWGLLTLIAITEERWTLAFSWIAIATLVDGLDGALARLANVKNTLPDFDGALLDNMVDYFNYVIVPGFLLYYSDLLPVNWRILLPAIIALASAYQFSQGDAKTSDNYFKGFPSYWNITVFYLFYLALSPIVNLGILLFLVVLVFVPVKYVYPSRTVRLQQLTLVLSFIWGVLTIAVVFSPPDIRPWLLRVSLLYVFYYVGLSLYSTYVGPVLRR